jgi:hypothetical protein
VLAWPAIDVSEGGMSFHVGQSVECIDARGSACLRSKQIYSCLAIEPEFVRVDCCTNPDHEMHRWLTRRFRPIGKKTDISTFTAMLNQKQREHSLCGND